MSRPAIPIGTARKRDRPPTTVSVVRHSTIDGLVGIELPPTAAGRILPVLCHRQSTGERIYPVGHLSHRQSWRQLADPRTILDIDLRPAVAHSISNGIPVDCRSLATRALRYVLVILAMLPPYLLPLPLQYSLDPRYLYCDIRNLAQLR